MAVGFCSPPRFFIALSSCSNAHCAARRAGSTSIVYAFSWLRPITQSGAANTSKNVPLCRLCESEWLSLPFAGQEVKKM